MKKSTKTCLVVLFCCLAAFFIPSVSFASAEVGQQAPDITLSDQYDQMKSLSSLRGNLVLVYFWSSWDPNSRVNTPNLHILHSKYSNASFGNAKGFQVFTVSTDSEEDKWIEAIKKDKLPGAYHVNDFYSRSAAAYNIFALPSSFLLDENGVVIAKNLSMAQLDQTLASKAMAYGTVSDRTPVPASTPAPATVYTQPVTPQPTAPTPMSVTTPTPVISAGVPTVVYKIQLGAFKKVVISDYYKVSKYGQVNTEKVATSDVKRVLLGDYTSAERAVSVLKEIIADGHTEYANAFVVEYRNGQRTKQLSKTDMGSIDHSMGGATPTGDIVVITSPNHSQNLATTFSTTTSSFGTSTPVVDNGGQTSVATFSDISSTTTTTTTSTSGSLVPDNIYVFKDVNEKPTYYDDPKNLKNGSTWYPTGDGKVTVYETPAYGTRPGSTTTRGNTTNNQWKPYDRTTTQPGRVNNTSQNNKPATATNQQTPNTRGATYYDRQKAAADKAATDKAAAAAKEAQAQAQPTAKAANTKLSGALDSYLDNYEYTNTETTSKKLKSKKKRERKKKKRRKK